MNLVYKLLPLPFGEMEPVGVTFPRGETNNQKHSRDAGSGKKVTGEAPGAKAGGLPQRRRLSGQ